MPERGLTRVGEMSLVVKLVWRGSLMGEETRGSQSSRQSAGCDCQPALVLTL